MPGRYGNFITNLNRKIFARPLCIINILHYICNESHTCKSWANKLNTLFDKIKGSPLRWWYGNYPQRQMPNACCDFHTYGRLLIYRNSYIMKVNKNYESFDEKPFEGFDGVEEITEEMIYRAVRQVIHELFDSFPLGCIKEKSWNMFSAYIESENYCTCNQSERKDDTFYYSTLLEFFSNIHQFHRLWNPIDAQLC